MGLTAEQRRQQNKANAARSKGPISDEGKRTSSRNSLVHGLTAKILTLPDEDEAVIQAQADLWHDACHPENHDEEVIVDQIALAALRLSRLSKAETAIISEQTLDAQNQWVALNFEWYSRNTL